MEEITSEQLTVEECDEFKKLCAPLVEYIQKKYGSPHHYIIIDWSSAMIVQNLRSADFNPPD